ncbi:target of rapamycin complex 2 subunit MAPKAP1-like [Haliotis asinina]|uniref:target of rapamycin complex 2 subunit MAPKAP1-like n=1 Tax=Haliotis asinina TaxID=109174 RepID=UPI00353279F4
MAMMDDVDFLISHIRNSFITSDDTGMCELIIETDEAERTNARAQSFSTYANWNKCDSPPSPVDSGLDTSDELSHSYDILPDMDYGAHRRRSNTAQRLERLKKEKRNQCKVKTISWKDSQTNYSADDKGHLFEKKEVPPQESSRKGSFLSQQLDTHGTKGDNPFTEYAKFDGRASAGIATKKIDIFLTMAPADSRAYPMPVVVVATAKVEELIGLICWQYTHEAREPRMIEDTGVYWLHIAEDDGEVDMDFPSLDKREPVSKFGFSKLALVERAPAHPTPKKSLVVTINVPSRGFNKFQVDSMNVPMKDILNKVLKRRKIKVKPGLNYYLEKQSEPGSVIDLESTLAATDTMEFCLVRENSQRGDLEELYPVDSSDVAESLTSHQYKSYIVNMVHKLRTNTEVQLGVSGEKVEIDPVTNKGTGRLFKQKAVTYDADTIADCDIVENRSNGKCVFRMMYQTNHDYKHHDFEVEEEVATEIVQKINNILELRLSQTRKDFVAIRDKKRKRDSLKYS